MIETVEHPQGTFQVWGDLVGVTLKTGVFWDEQVRFVLDAADPHGWALDLGANIGFFTVYMARRFAHVVAVEAHPQTFALLEANLRANGVEHRVTALNVAAYDRQTKMIVAPTRFVGWQVPFDLNECVHPASIAYLPHNHAALTAEEMELRRPTEVWGGPIDELLPATAPVSVIKCDVQGCDLRALMGLRLTIQRCQPLIVYEVETGVSVQHGDDLDAHKAWFHSIGYESEQIRPDLWDFVAWPRGTERPR